MKAAAMAPRRTRRRTTRKAEDQDKGTNAIGEENLKEKKKKKRVGQQMRTIFAVGGGKRKG